MSNLIELELDCAHCHLPLKVEVWSIVNVKEDPKLKDVLVGGDLNFVECKSCKKRFYADQFFLYHDSNQELLAFVYPTSYAKEKDIWIKKTSTDFEALKESSMDDVSLTYEPLSLFGIEALLTLLKTDEEIGVQSEIVSVLSKENKFSLVHLRKFIARKHGVPPVFPRLKGRGFSKEKSVLEGFKVLESLNNRLSLYKVARERFEKELEIQNLVCLSIKG